MQEAVGKCAELADLRDVEWHLIGPLHRTNRAMWCETMHWVHAVNRLKIAERLSSAASAGHAATQCLHSGEHQWRSVEERLRAGRGDLAGAGRSLLPQLRVRGLMGMPEPGIGDVATRRQFTMLASLFAEAKRTVA